MNYKTCSPNMLISLIIILSSVFLTAELSAYDGDVDYSAPYITVDPETGKLVTIDPKAQQQQHPAVDPNLTQASAATTQKDTGVQDNQVMAQSTPGNAINQSGNGESTTSSPVNPMLIGIVVLVLAAVVVISARRNKA